MVILAVTANGEVMAIILETAVRDGEKNKKRQTVNAPAKRGRLDREIIGAL
jgi:hypothetical protein